MWITSQSVDKLPDLKGLFSRNVSVSLCVLLSLGALFCFPSTFLVNFPLKMFHLVIRKLEGIEEVVAAASSAG